VIRIWTPQDVFIAALRVQDFVREEPKNSNAGQAVESMQKATGNAKGDPWCMSFVSRTGRKCFNAAWPLPMTGGCQVAADAAQHLGIRALPDAAAIGDIVVQYRPKKRRFGHVYVIVGPYATGKGWPTIEGNTNHGGSDEGYGVFPRYRILGADDRVIQWWRLIT
jgi:hypothetical protein